VTLTSSQPGTDVLQILSSLPGVQHEITYHQPQPAGLRLEATPGEVINDGKSPVRVVVMLVDAGKTMVNASQNIEVVLGSTGGTITPAKLIVPAGQCCAEAKLTSAQHGAITITANALQLPAATIPAVFLFPWMMVMMGALGGLLGAFVHNPKAAISSHWWIVLVLGLIFGVILSIAAMFGVIGSLPKLGLPIQLSQIPSANELGALLLGFVGGFYGKKLWLKGGGDEDKENEKGKGPHKGKAKEKAAAQPE